MRRYSVPASARDGSAVPGCGRGAVPTRCQEPQPAAARVANSATSPSRLTCPTSNPDVSFARSHVQRKPRRPDHRRLPPPRARRRGRHGRSLPGRAPGARPLRVQGIATASAGRPHGGETLPAGGRLRLARPATERVKLLDFGIARDAELPAEERLTRTGFFVGTLQYVAPEALSGELVDGRADIFSLATITYWLLTGVHPYTGRTPRELFQQLLTAAPVPLNQAVVGLEFPAALQAAVMRGLARDPAQRQPTVTTFAAEVEAGIAAGPAPKGGGLLDALKRAVGRRRERR